MQATGAAGRLPPGQGECPALSWHEASAALQQAVALADQASLVRGRGAGVVCAVAPFILPRNSLPRSNTAQSLPRCLSASAQGPRGGAFLCAVCACSLPCLATATACPACAPQGEGGCHRAQCRALQAASTQQQAALGNWVAGLGRMAAPAGAARAGGAAGPGRHPLCVDVVQRRLICLECKDWVHLDTFGAHQGTQVREHACPHPACRRSALALPGTRTALRSQHPPTRLLLQPQYPPMHVGNGNGYPGFVLAEPAHQVGTGRRLCSVLAVPAR